MPGLLSQPGTGSAGAVAGMKRSYAAADIVPSYGEPHPKKRRVVHQLHYTQPTQHIVEPISGEISPFGESKDFFDHQLRRALAIQCRTVGFAGARPDALQEFQALVDSYMSNFCDLVRRSMTSARRTEPVAHDWIYALASVEIRGSGVLESRLETGDIPVSILQPTFDAPIPPEASPPDMGALLGPGLSGNADKESRPYIPSHLPPFPSRHTYRSTPVFTTRENDPRKIREKATEEGIQAEQSLRKLMAARKAGLQKQNKVKRKRSQRMKDSDKLWLEAMKDVLVEEHEREHEDQQRRAREEDEDEWGPPLHTHEQPTLPERTVNIEEGVSANYEQKFWREAFRPG